MDINNLNKGMLFAGRLSEVHEKNLKTYPFLVFDHLDSARLEYDLTKWLDASLYTEGVSPEPFVKYTLVFKTTPPKNFEDLAQILKKTIKTFLFKEVSVIVVIGSNNESAYGITENIADFNGSANKVA